MLPFTILVLHLSVLLRLFSPLLAYLILSCFAFRLPLGRYFFLLFVFLLLPLVYLSPQLPGHDLLLLSLCDFWEIFGFFGAGGNRLESHLAAKQITSPTLLISTGVPCLVFILFFPVKPGNNLRFGLLVPQSLVAVLQQVGIAGHKLPTGSIILVLDIGPGRGFITCLASGLLQGVFDFVGNTVSDFPISVIPVLSLLVVLVDKGIVAFY